MKIFDKTLKEYFSASKIPLITLFLIALIRLISYELDIVKTLWDILNILFVLSIILVVYAGWRASRKYGFSSKQIVIVGILLFLVSFWVDPLLNYVKPETNPLPGIGGMDIEIGTNLMIMLFYIIGVLFGGWLARRLKK